MQNLREAIAGYRTRLMHEGHEGKRNALLQVPPLLPAFLLPSVMRNGLTVVFE